MRCIHLNTQRGRLICQGKILRQSAQGYYNLTIRVRVNVSVRVKQRVRERLILTKRKCVRVRVTGSVRIGLSARVSDSKATG